MPSRPDTGIVRLACALALAPPAACIASACPEESEWLPAVALASAALGETAPPGGAGADATKSTTVAVLVRRRACEVLEENSDLLPATVLALENECTRMETKLPTNGSERDHALQELIDTHPPDLLALAWRDEADPSLQWAMASNGASALRLRWTGYGSEQPMEVLGCERSPWAF